MYEILRTRSSADDGPIPPGCDAMPAEHTAATSYGMLKHYMQYGFQVFNKSSTTGVFAVNIR